MDSSNKRFYDLNQTDSVTEATDNSGNILGQFAYRPFGQSSQLQGGYVPDFGFAGYYLHARSSLNLTLARGYNSTIGRFLNRDPISESGGTNQYVYVQNLVTMLVDPSGLQECSPCGLPDPETGPYPWTTGPEGPGPYPSWIFSAGTINWMTQGAENNPLFTTPWPPGPYSNQPQPYIPYIPPNQNCPIGPFRPPYTPGNSHGGGNPPFLYNPFRGISGPTWGPRRG
jgi:RHS repeat-associated protein